MAVYGQGSSFVSQMVANSNAAGLLQRPIPSHQAQQLHMVNLQLGRMAAHQHTAFTLQQQQQNQNHPKSKRKQQQQQTSTLSRIDIFNIWIDKYCLSFQQASKQDKTKIAKSVTKGVLPMYHGNNEHQIYKKVRAALRNRFKQRTTPVGTQKSDGGCIPNDLIIPDDSTDDHVTFTNKNGPPCHTQKTVTVQRDHREKNLEKEKEEEDEEEYITFEQEMLRKNDKAQEV